MGASKKWITYWADKEGFRPMFILWLGVSVTLLFFIAAGFSIWEAHLRMVRTEEHVSALSDRVSGILYHEQRRSEAIFGAAEAAGTMLEDSNSDVPAELIVAFSAMQSAEPDLHVAGSALHLKEIRLRLVALQDSALKLIRSGRGEDARALMHGSEYGRLEGELHETARGTNLLAAVQAAGARRVFTARLWWISIVAAIFFIALNVAWLAVMRLVGINLTERRKAAAELSESEGKYRTLIDALPHAVLIAQDSRFVFCNRSAVTMFGSQSPSQLIGQDGEAVIPEEEKVRLRGYTEARLTNQNHAPDHYIVSLLKSNGETFPAEVFVRNVGYRGRSALQLVILDVTERQQAECALRESEEKYRTLIDALPYTVVILQNYRVVFCNPAAVSAFGFSNADEFIGLDSSRFVPAGEAERLRAYTDKRLHGDTTVPNHYSVNLLRRNQEEFPAEI